MEKIEVEKLISRIRENDQNAFSALLAAYQPLISAAVTQYGQGLTASDAEDLHQIALLAFYRACLNYDFAQNEVQFGLYAKICVSNALTDQLRKLKNREEELPIEEIAEIAEAPSEANPAQILAEEEKYALLLSRIHSCLSPFESKVWRLVMSGYRSGDIAKLLGKDAHSIENAVFRIRQKLRRELGGRK